MRFLASIESEPETTKESQSGIESLQLLDLPAPRLTSMMSPPTMESVSDGNSLLVNGLSKEKLSNQGANVRKKS